MNDNAIVNSTYAKYRMERAVEELQTAKEMLSLGHYRAANNRAYYSIFHAMRAVLAFDGFDSKKHSGIIAYFRKEYIKTGILDSKLSDIIGSAFEIRNASDYDDMYLATKAEASEQIEQAEYFLEAIKFFLDSKISED